ncbi:InlB B-repeat-containing protein [Glaciibacter psychrotolerans]|uniref:Putative repeat protein (TIGR02543 family) n=1 Tax=Glaciibacter psychrotolerans TaxID=670054 RepID=A0A7Z0J727_9MICO|nr:InlB B-repeat-containing protein [Leifsonia psychrotolerans]NYJ20494.1 putative repeat protein (TIGR02543 family) [Leifsonia psychrotolerans]
MTTAHPRARTMQLGALGTATFLAAGLALVPALPAMAAPLTASVSTAAELDSALLASAGTSTTITLANSISTLGLAVPSTGTVTVQLGAFSLTSTRPWDGVSEGAGFEVASGASLTVEGTTGTLSAIGAPGSAGIGGSRGQDAGTIVIKSGNVIAKARPGGGAAIGGGTGGSGGSTTIRGGTVKATVDNFGSGIGGGRNGAAGTILISGGTVTAVGSLYGGAAIGTGEVDPAASATTRSGGSITISGGTVLADGHGIYSPGIGGRGGATGPTPLTIHISQADAAVPTIVGSNPGHDGTSIGGGRNEPGVAVTIGVGAVVRLNPHFSYTGSAIGGSGTASSQFGTLSNAGELRVTPGATMTIPVGALVTNTGGLMGAGAIVNHGVIVTSESVSSIQGTTINTGIIVNTKSFTRSATNGVPLTYLPSLTFDRNDGSTPAQIMQLFAPSLAVGSADIIAGPLLNAVVQSPTRAHHTFAGWATTAAGGILWDPATAITASPTIYAQWIADSYTVSFNSQDGTAVADTTATHGGLITEPAAPTRPCYTFAGWSTTPDGTPWNFATDTITGPTTFYAQWVINSYTVSFDSQGGTAVADTAATHGEFLTEPAAPTRTNYTFLGWSTTPGGTPWNFATDTVTEPTTLYAQWVIKSYTVAFTSQGGTAVADTTATHDALLTEPAEPTRTGYTFAGWATTAPGGTPWNFATNTVTEPTTLYAQWTADSYTVIFTTHGGTAVADTTVTFDGLVTEPAEPTRTGYAFAGWSTTPGGTPWNFATDTITGPTTLHAQWTADSYTVSFNSQDGTAVADTTAAHDGLLTEPAAPTRTGYTFIGWSTTPDGTPWNFATDTITGPTTFYAQWTVTSVVPPTPDVPTAAPTPPTTVVVPMSNPQKALASTGSDTGGAPWLALGLIVAGMLGLAWRRTRPARG